MGRALEASLSEGDAVVHGPFTRAEVAAGAVTRSGAEVVLLAVTDAAIAEVAGTLAPGRIVGHLSGATPLAVLEPHESFVLHPLLTVTGASDRFVGAWATVSGSSDLTLGTAHELCELLGLRHLALREDDRAAYHAAASVASNFVMTVLGCAEDLAAEVGLEREALAPLVQASLDNWGRLGARDALTGPIARGDDATVARQRAAVEHRQPHHLHLFDALVTATKEMASAR